MSKSCSRPWGIIPEPNAAWLGTIGCTSPLDGYLLIKGQRIPWPKNNSLTFAVYDYENEDFLRLKANARHRGMTECKLRSKAAIVAVLREWDAIMQNQTPVQQ